MQPESRAAKFLVVCLELFLQRSTGHDMLSRWLNCIVLGLIPIIMEVDWCYRGGGRSCKSKTQKQLSILQIIIQVFFLKMGFEGLQQA